jgi:PLP dependent protein
MDVTRITEETIRSRWNELLEEVDKACSRACRKIDEITIVGVSKYVPAEIAGWLYQAGCTNLGESRPQSLWEKQDYFRNLGTDLQPRWHMIGHLQRNKVARTIRELHLLHSIDSIRLAKQVESDSKQLGFDRDNPVQGLIEVNISGDPSKTGQKMEEVDAMIEALAEVPSLRIVGLMGMAGLNESEPRKDFAKLRALRDRLQEKFTKASGSDRTVSLEHLSMGMSGDFVEAIQEGATILRIGSRLFES